MNKVSKQSTLTHSIVHYLFTVHKLREEGKRSRLTDVASVLGHARSSVTIAFKKLRKKGLLQEDEKNNLFLTKKAHMEVHNVLSTRMLLYFFFIEILKVSNKNAIKNACNIEHLLCPEIQEKLFIFMKGQMKKKIKSKSHINKEDVHKIFCSFEDLEEFKKSQGANISFK